MVEVLQNCCKNNTNENGNARKKGRKYNEITMDRRNKTLVTVKFSNYLKKEIKWKTQ